MRIQKMMMIESFKPSYKGHPVNCGEHNEHGVYRLILKGIHDQLVALLSYHSRITIVRVDLHFPIHHNFDDRADNEDISWYIQKFKTGLRSFLKKSDFRVIHCWVKEVGESGRSHYHLFFGFEAVFRVLGAQTAAGHTGLWRSLESTWKRLTGGSVHFSKSWTFD